MMFDLLIAGAGDLGLRVAKILKTTDPNLLIACETKSSKSHRFITELGFYAKLSTEAPCIAKNLLISFPPSTDHYLSEIERSFSQWNQLGSAVFVSSTGIYLNDLKGDVFENSPTLNEGPLFEAEKIASKHRAHVCRLAGLYSKDRGPHIFWEKQTRSLSHPQGLVNLLHRHDAARALSGFFKKEIPPETWNISDENPLPRELINQLWSEWKKCRPVSFDPLSPEKAQKKIRSQKIREKLAWHPLIENFPAFLQLLKNPELEFLAVL